MNGRARGAPPFRWWLSLLTIGAVACTGPPLELQASLDEATIDRGAPLRGRVVLQNLTDAEIEVSSPGLPEIAMSVYQDGERIGGNEPYVLNEVWQRTLPPGRSFTHVDEILFRSVDLEPGDYELLAELWTHQYGTLRSGLLAFVVR